MLYYLSQQILDWSAGTAWAESVSSLRLFGYITFRSAGAAITALLLSWMLGPRVICWLKRLKFGQDYRDKAEEAGNLTARLLSKKGTPTMGGILIILALNFTTLLWAKWETMVQLTLLSVVVLTALGFYDDLCQDHPTEWRRNAGISETPRTDGSGTLYRVLPLEYAFQE